MENELPSQNLRIRPFDFEKDLQKVLELWAQAGPGVHLSRSDQPHEIKKKLRKDPDLFLVAEEGDVLIGAVLGGFDGRRGMVYHLAIEKGHRNKGVGKLLMQELEDRLRSKDCLKYYLLVTRDNPEALEFYKEIGCEIMDMFLMGKELK